MTHVHESSAVGDEYRRRMNMLAQLRALPGEGSDFTPKAIGQVGMARGEQGIFFDKMATHHLASPGVTVSLKVTGRIYDDTVVGDSIIYRYPRTERPPGRDRAEVLATQNAGELSLPVFTIFSKGDRRIVICSWIEDWDDRQASFLLFLDRAEQGARDKKEVEHLDISALPLNSTPSLPSAADDPDDDFRFRVLKAYGSNCSCCDVRCPFLIQAVRILDRPFTGRNSILNGLPVCPTHKMAIEEGLLKIGTRSNTWFALSGEGDSLESLGVTRDGLDHLNLAPSAELLARRFGVQQIAREVDQ